ncbi:MAG TPA: M20/M25/M40 family metallo-hydrolase, partial [Anaerolineaceae bacterium]|nr:M20/M25/M40 family metallo-hydrolase [Anaerolineaceae bacterium]
GLTGLSSLTIGSQDVIIESRDDAQNLQEVTQALYEFMQAQGLEVSYQDWYDDEEDAAGRNVIGELPGLTRPEEIVILSAHIDSYCEETRCVGADDNASGATGVLIAAENLSGMRFERTLRFVFFTGEEIDLLGSYYYAEDLKANDENVVAVINLDMLGWDGDGNGAALLYTHTCGRQTCSQDQAIAEAFIQAVKTYRIEDFYPQITKGEYDSTDAYSFWEAGFPAIFAIEDDQDEENPYYHTDEDTLDTLDLAYLTTYIRAAVATVAELAMPK